MRPEKTYLVREASEYLSRSNYFFLTDYKGIDSEETSELRKKLSERGAEFHVVKNSSLKIAAKEKELPDLSEFLVGHTAIIVGGDDVSGVAKAITTFNKDTKKVSVKAGALEDKILSADEVKTLSNLPSIEILQSKLLSLLNTPSTQLVSVLSATPRSMVTVLKAKADKSNN